MDCDIPFGDQTQGSEVGFLWDPVAYLMFVRKTEMAPRRCRHCGAQLRFTGQGAVLCTGSCDRLAGDLTEQLA